MVSGLICLFLVHIWLITLSQKARVCDIFTVAKLNFLMLASGAGETSPFSLGV